MSKYADIILHSNFIFTATSKPIFKGYIAIKDNKILAVEQGDMYKELVDSHTKIYDLQNRLICPGFSDVHCFFSGYSINFVGTDLSSVTSIEELSSALKEYSKTIPPSKPLLGNSLDFEIVDTSKFSLIDSDINNRPIILFARNGEACWMNKIAEDTYHFDPSTCYPEAFWMLLKEVLSDRSFIIPAFKEYMKMMNSKGITSVKEMGFDDFYGFTDILQDLDKKNELTLRVHFMSQPVSRALDIDFGKKMRAQIHSEFVHFSGYNKMTDGSISQMCGYLKEPYNCSPFTKCNQEIDWNLIEKEVMCVDNENFRFSLHAQGDAAISNVLDIYEKCKLSSNNTLINKHCITDLEFSDPKDLERMGKLGVIAEIYPQIQSIADKKSKTNMIKEKIGENRGNYYWNRRKMADSNVILSCGTDLPLLIDDIPESIYHAVGMQFPEGGEPFNESNALTIDELLTAWTQGGAYNLSQEDKLGTLEAGKLADISVLSENVFHVKMESMRNVVVDLTIVNGNIVYQNLNIN